MLEDKIIISPSVWNYFCTNSQNLLVTTDLAQGYKRMIHANDIFISILTEKVRKKILSLTLLYKPCLPVVAGGVVISDSHSMVHLAPVLCFFLLEMKDTFRELVVVLTSGLLVLQYLQGVS